MLLSDPLVIALGSAIIGALLVAFVQPIWTNRIGPKSSLSVTVSISPFSLSTFLRKSISDYADLRWNAKSNIRPSKESIEKLSSTALCSNYIQVSIVNSSNKSIDGISLSLKNHFEFIADVSVGKSSRETFFGSVCEIGELKPQSECKVDIWSGSLWYSSKYPPDKDLVKITAREYDRILVKYPEPLHIKSNYFLLSKNLIATLSIFVVPPFAILIIAMTKYFS